MAPLDSTITQNTGLQPDIAAQIEEIAQNIDLKALDSVIDSYDYENDPLLTAHFHDIEQALWTRIENYASDSHEYGAVLSQHLRRVSMDGREFLVNKLGFSEKAARNFHAANLLHDLGKTHQAYNENIWNLPHCPTQKERELKRLHTRRGVAVFLDAIKNLPDAVKAHPHLRIVIPALMIFHHERVDGSGYEGRGDKDLGTLIRALSIVDCKDGDLVQRGHHVNKRTEQDALMRMKSHPDFDKDAKYKGAFCAMLDTYIEYREEKTGTKIRV